jgi:hypothetical protein
MEDDHHDIAVIAGNETILLSKIYRSTIVQPIGLWICGKGKGKYSWWMEFILWTSFLT